MAITPPDPPARLLDLTRLVSRAGQRMTGVDRVEHAYLAGLLDGRAALFGLVRTSLGYVLLDRAGCARLLSLLDSGDWGARDALGRMQRRLDPVRARAEADLRRIGVARCLPVRLGAMIARHLPRGTHYLNVGHTNFTDRTVTALRRVQDMRIGVLVHDTIPLDFPEYQRPGTRDRFAAFLRRAGRWADLILCNSRATEADILRHLTPHGLSPRTVVAHLGVPELEPGSPPPGPWNGRPYFVALGTIEPRKNHAFLLDLWQDMTDPPPLVIIGRRGWENHDVFARLDRGIAGIHELGDLPDAEAFGLLAGSAGLLFPSLAEGYGLPPIEAAALKVPVLCNDLSVFREVLGDIPVYANVSDRYLWQKTIDRLARENRAEQPGTNRKGDFAPPTWSAHFNTVFTLI